MSVKFQIMILITTCLPVICISFPKFEYSAECQEENEENRTLVCFNTSLTHIPNISEPHTLIGLILSFNQLSKLSVRIFESYTALRILHLDHNMITNLEAGIFDNLTSLRELHLDHNMLTNLEARIFDNLRSIRELHLDHNMITNLEAGIFENLTSLRELHLDHNMLTNLEDRMFDYLRSMRELKLNNNRITSLPLWIFLRGLQLTRIDLGYNRLTDLSNHVFPTPFLKVVSVRNNMISDVSFAAFSSNAFLEELDMGNNPIQSLHNSTFLPMRSLKYLRLTGCQLTSLEPVIFQYSTALQVLLLQDNKLESLPSELFETPKTTMKLLSIPILCNCIETRNDLLPFIQNATFNTTVYYNNVDVTSEWMNQVQKCNTTFIDMPYCAGLSTLGTQDYTSFETSIGHDTSNYSAIPSEVDAVTTEGIIITSVISVLGAAICTLVVLKILSRPNSLIQCGNVAQLDNTTIESVIEDELFSFDNFNRENKQSSLNIPPVSYLNKLV